MSRIIVKNLPKRIDEQKFKEHFNQKANVTDIQLKYTKDGKFRQFGFVGFQTEEQAQEAIKFFDKTFIHTSRVTVEICKELNQKIYEADPNVKKDEKGNIYVKELLDQHKNDPLFKEFIETHEKPKALWRDDVISESINEDTFEVVKSDVDEKLANKDINDKEYMKSLVKKSEKSKKPMVELFTVKLRNLPKNTKRQDVQKFFKPLKPHSVRIPGLKLRFAYAGFKTKQELTKALAKHKSFFNGKQIEVYDFSLKNNLPSKDSEKTKDPNNKWQGQTQSLEGEESVCESGKLFFRNLAYTITENDLQEVFEPFGPVADIKVPVDATTRKIKGFGTVTFVMPEHAVKAYSSLNGTMFHGRMFHLLPGKMDDKDKDGDDGTDDTNYKKKKDEKLKKTAGSSHNWNTLFMGPNAVAEVLSKDYNMSKEGVLDFHGGGSSAAVRLALGETEIVQKMKNFLEKNLVCLKSFDGTPKERSKTVLLAKNLPSETTEQDLKPMFLKFGPLGRFIFPPFGVTCLIEYLDSSEAKKAFKGLAYKMFKGQPLYLEWAPEQTFTSNNITSESNVDTNAKTPEMPKEEILSKEDIKNVYDDEQPDEGTTLFIKNLNFKTIEAAVLHHFEKIGSIHSVQIVTKPDPKNVKVKVSAGYGFIQFKKRASLEKALKMLQFSEIDGNKIELKRSDRTLRDISTVKKLSTNSKQIGTKILIRNIPFQAKESELQDVFKVFGELKALRLPKKMNAETHRGFGFAEYHTKDEAKRAFDTLSGSTHLYGRRLVLEWALDESVEDIRKRTADHFAGDDRKPTKKGNSVFNMEDYQEKDEQD